MAGGPVGVADKESVQLIESLQRLSFQIETVTDFWRQSPANADWLLPHFLRLVDTLRGHHALLLGFNPDWNSFLEFKAHVAALNQFRSQLSQWVVIVRLPGAQGPLQSDFDVSAWRVLGAGALLLDVYKQANRGLDSQGELKRSAWARWVVWFRRGD